MASRAQGRHLEAGPPRDGRGVGQAAVAVLRSVPALSDGRRARLCRPASARYAHATAHDLARAEVQPLRRAAELVPTGAAWIQRAAIAADGGSGQRGRPARLAAHSHRYLAAPATWPTGERKDAMMLEAPLILRLPNDAPYPIWTDASEQTVAARRASICSLQHPVGLKLATASAAGSDRASLPCRQLRPSKWLSSKAAVSP